MNTTGYISLDELNQNEIYAPIGHEESFYINLDIEKTIEKNIYPHIFQYKTSIEQILDPYFLETNSKDFIPVYRAGTKTEYFASWDNRPEGWKSRGTKYHRKLLKQQLINNFNHYYNECFELY